MRLAVLALAAALVLAGCGDAGRDGDASGFVPAAGPETPAARAPGVPPGSSYDVTGDAWLKLPDASRLTAARDYVADHPGECTNAAGRSAATATVRDWADASLGVDYPLNAPVAELLAEGCAAALQSGERDLAP